MSGFSSMYRVQGTWSWSVWSEIIFNSQTAAALTAPASFEIDFKLVWNCLNFDSPDELVDSVDTYIETSSEYYLKSQSVNHT